MATNQPDVEDLITCDVCFEWYTSPRRLPCPHVYCLTCLRDMVRKNRDKKRIRCPECRVKHIVPENGVDGFPLDVKLHHFIKNMEKTQGKEAKDEDGPPATCSNESSDEESIIEDDSDSDQFLENHTRYYITYSILIPPKQLRHRGRELELISTLCFWYILELVFKLWANDSAIFFSLSQLVILLIVLFFVFKTENGHPLYDNDNPYIIRSCLYIICVILNLLQIWDLCLYITCLVLEPEGIKDLCDISKPPTASSEIMTKHLVFCTLHVLTAWSCFSTLRYLRDVRRWQELTNQYHMEEALAERRRNRQRPQQRRRRQNRNRW